MADMKVLIGADIKELEAKLQRAGDVTQNFATKSAAANAQVGASFQKISGHVGASIASISSLGATLISGGIIAGIALVSTALIKLGENFYGATKAQQQFKNVLDGAKDSYIKAVLEVDKMKDAFEKARSGVISKEAALKIYNSTIGKTIGQTNDLGIAEKNFIANADNYIKFTLLKAAANVAMEKAAGAAFKAEEERLSGPRKLTFVEDILTGGRYSKEEAQLSRIRVAEKERNSFQQIYNNLIAQANALQFKGIEQTEKEITLEKKITKQKLEKISIDRTVFYAPKVKVPELTIEPGIVKFGELKFADPTEEQKQKVSDGMKKLFDEQKAIELSEAFTAIINNTIQDAISAVAEGVGDIIAGTGGLTNLFDGLLKVLGNGLKQLGRYLVSTYTYIAVLEKIQFANPVVGIAVGVALQILGAVVSASVKSRKAFASGVRSFGGGTALVGERGPERIFLPSGSSLQPNNEVQAYGGGQMVFIPSITLSGSDLVIAFNRASAQMLRNS